MNFQAEILCHPIYFFYCCTNQMKSLKFVMSWKWRNRPRSFTKRILWNGQIKRSAMLSTFLILLTHLPAIFFSSQGHWFTHSLVVLVTMDTGSRLAPTASHPSVGTVRTGWSVKQYKMCSARECPQMDRQRTGNICLCTYYTVTTL